MVPTADPTELHRVTLGGLPFVVPSTSNPDCPSTTDHQLYMMEVAQAAHLLPFFEPGGLTGDLEHDGLKMFGAVLKSGRVYDVLAGLLVRENQQLRKAPPGFTQAPTMWDRDQVEETALLFRHMSGEDAAKLRIILAQLVLSFFTTGALSKTASLSSLLEPRTGKQRHGGRGRGPKTAAPRRSGSGRK